MTKTEKKTKLNRNIIKYWNIKKIWKIQIKKENENFFNAF